VAGRRGEELSTLGRFRGGPGAYKQCDKKLLYMSYRAVI
jgi:hypothetical protein